MSSPDRIRFRCTHCDKKLSVLPAAAGRTLPCRNPECGKPITVPPPGAIATATPAIPLRQGFGGQASAGQPEPGNAPSIVVFTTPSRRRAMPLIAAAFSMVSLALGLAFFLIKPYASLHKARSAVKAVVNGAGKAAVKAKAKATASRSNNPESQRKLAAAKQQKSKAAQKEQAARKERSKTLADYATLAHIQSFEYYHNDRRILPRWHRPRSEVTRERTLILDKYDDDLPRIRPLAHSANKDIRNVAASFLKSYEMAELYRKDGVGSGYNVMADVQKAAAESESYDQFRDRRARSLGRYDKTQGAVDAANWKRTLGIVGNFQRQRNANQSYLNALDEIAMERKRRIYKLAKEFAGPQGDQPAGIRLNVEAFVPGEEVFRGGEPSANATYCITVTNEGKKLTHCSIAVIIRHMAIRRTGRMSRPDFGPPFGLDEFTDAMLRPEASQAHWDAIVPYYIGELNTHDQVHFLEILGRDVRESIERVGVVMFSDEMTVALDPNPGFQEMREHHP